MFHFDLCKTHFKTNHQCFTVKHAKKIETNFRIYFGCFKVVYHDMGPVSGRPLLFDLPKQALMLISSCHLVLNPAVAYMG
jgi:hypothetical protein